MNILRLHNTRYTQYHSVISTKSCISIWMTYINLDDQIVVLNIYPLVLYTYTFSYEKKNFLKDTEIIPQE